MTLRALLFALTIAAAALPAARAQAPDEARVAVAKQLMDAAGAGKQFDEVMPLLAAQISQNLMRIAPDKSKDIADVFQKLIPRFSEKKGILLEQIAGLYANELTLEELNVIVAFYKSPVGMKFAAVQPNIMRQSMTLGQRWGQQIGIELDAEARQELKKRGVDL
jgi:uncharacterized protein